MKRFGDVQRRKSRPWLVLVIYFSVLFPLIAPDRDEMGVAAASKTCVAFTGTLIGMLVVNPVCAWWTNCAVKFIAVAIGFHGQFSYFALFSPAIGARTFDRRLFLLGFGLYLFAFGVLALRSMS